MMPEDAESVPTARMVAEYVMGHDPFPREGFLAAALLAVLDAADGRARDPRRVLEAYVTADRLVAGDLSPAAVAYASPKPADDLAMMVASEFRDEYDAAQDDPGGCLTQRDVAHLLHRQLVQEHPWSGDRAEEIRDRLLALLGACDAAELEDIGTAVRLRPDELGEVTLEMVMGYGGLPKPDDPIYARLPGPVESRCAVLRAAVAVICRLGDLPLPQVAPSGH
jgi:hypothetical protein